MSSSQKLQSTSEGDFWKFYPGVQVSDYYVSSENCVKPAEKAQTGNEIKYSVPISLGTTATVNLPLGNYNFMGNMFLRITGTRGRNHSPVNCPLPGMDANKKTTISGTNFKYATPTGNFLPMNGYDLIDEIQLTLPGDDYYTLKGDDIFLWCMSQCESDRKRNIFWETVRIDPAVDRLACDEYPDTILYGATNGDSNVANAATDLMGGVTGRQRVISSALSVPFECVLMLPFPWCSPNKDRRPKPFPTYKFGNSQQITLNITWKKSELINESVTASHAVLAEECQLIPSTCDLHFEYFNFATKSQLSAIESYVYPAASLYPINFKSGALKVLSGGSTVGPITYSMLVNGLRSGETSHLLISFLNETGEMVIPSSFELNVGGQILFKQVDTQGKLAKAFELPYDDVSEEFYDERFKYVADATKYQGGNLTTLSIVTTGTSGFPSTSGTNVPAVANINLEKKSINGLPICNYMMIPLGRNACSTNYHNYALGARFDGMDTQLSLTFQPYWNIAENVYKNVNITDVKIIQVMNGFWQFTGDKVKLYR